MSQYKFETVLNIGDKVYHATKESDMGIIIDVSFSIRANCVKYEVCFGRFDVDDVWVYEEELSNYKVF